MTLLTSGGAGPKNPMTGLISSSWRISIPDALRAFLLALLFLGLAYKPLVYVDLTPGFAKIMHVTLGFPRYTFFKASFSEVAQYTHVKLDYSFLLPILVLFLIVFFTGMVVGRAFKVRIGADRAPCVGECNSVRVGFLLDTRRFLCH